MIWKEVQYMDFTKLRRNLEANGFAVSCFDTAADAAAYIDSVTDGKTVGFGGSVTLQQMGLFETLSRHNRVTWHWRVPEGVSPAQVYSASASAQVYLSSVNGAAETGELINIDGTGNRVSAIQYGHEKVILVIGKNKIAPDYESALWRARNVAAPKNAQRLERKTPCAVRADRCYNCSSPDRICRGLSVLWKKPGKTEYEVILINQDLGY